MEALILAAGKGTRMRSEIPKVLHPIFGRPVLEYVLAAVGSVGCRKPRAVVGSGAAEVKKFLKERGKPFAAVAQNEQRGTGHAVMCARQSLKDVKGDLLIWPGDMPLLKRETIAAFIQEHRKADAAASVLSAEVTDPAGYGRIIRRGSRVTGIREELDASDSERQISEINTGVYLFRMDALLGALKNLRSENAKNEFYLTDTIELLAQSGHCVAAFALAAGEESQGINSRRDLALAVKIMNEREIRRHQENGVTFMAPEQTFVAPGVVIGPDTVIYPWSFLESGVKIGRGCEIGPFAKLRKGAVIGDGAVIGSFVEVTRTKVGKKVMAKHLSYLGDAVIGDGTNIGAGTITANFDGKRKNVTRIGRNVLVGSDTVFVAPVNLADGARTGAGAVVTRGSRVKKGETFAGVPARSLGRKRSS